ncbi:MAG: alpha/beta fold hydrolase [Actinomycetota bacterium]
MGRSLIMLLLTAVVGGLAWAVIVGNSIPEKETVDPALAAPGRIITLPGETDIHFQERGTGPPVLLIHSFDLAGSYQWLALIDHIRGHRLIMPDMIDFGYSPRLSQPGRLHTVIGRAETLVSFVEELGITKVAVVGAGYGGAVAAQMAALAPELVGQLVLVAPEIYGPGPSWQSFLYGLPIVAEAASYTFLGGGSQAVSTYSSGCHTEGWCPTREDLVARSAAAAVEGTASALAAMASTPAASTLPDGLSAISAPVLLIWGDIDSVTPLTQGRDLEAAIAGSELQVVAGAGHLPHRQDAAATADLIARFLDRS